MNPSRDPLSEIELIAARAGRQLVYCRVGLELAVVLAVIEFVLIVAR